MLDVVTLEDRPTAELSSEAGLLPLVRLAMPLVVSRAGLAAMTIADGWMVAHFASGQLALTSLADGTFGRVTDVFVAFVMSALPLVGAAAAGAAETRLAFWRRATAAALLLGFCGIGLAALSPPVFGAMVEPDLARGGSAIVWILGLGLPAGLAALASAMYLEGTRRPAVVAGWVLAANALNIALNWMLIDGRLGFPAWGAYGSACATTLVRWALALALAATVRRVEGGRVLFSRAVDRTGAAAQWRFGLSAAGATAGFHALAIWLTVFAGWLGPQALAAFASCWVLTMPPLLLAIGIGDAIGLREAARNRPARSLWRDLACLGAILAPFSLIPMLAPVAITDLYTPDSALRALIAGSLPIAATVLWLDGIGYGIGAALRARGDIKGSTAIQIGTMGATPVLAALLTFECHLDMRGLFLAVLATSTARLILLLRRLGRRIHLGDAPHPSRQER